MGDIVVLPSAAARPVINPKRMGRRARGGKVTLACDLDARRCRKERARRERAASADLWENLAASLARDVRAVIKEAGRQTKHAEQVGGGCNV